MGSLADRLQVCRNERSRRRLSIVGSVTLFLDNADCSARELMLAVGRGSTLSITHIFAIDCSRGFDESGEQGKALRAEGPLLKPSRERERATDSAGPFGARNTGFTSLRKRNKTHVPPTWCSWPPSFLQSRSVACAPGSVRSRRFAGVNASGHG